MSDHGSEVRTAHSKAADARLAVREFHASVRQPDSGLVIFFCSSHYDLDALADEMNRCFAGVPVVGCTTAGEIGPAGYCDRSLSGVSFSAGAFKVAAGLLEGLMQFDIGKGKDFAGNLLHKLEALGGAGNGEQSFGFLLIDGLSVREEPVVRTFQSVLGKIPLVGGSAGDDLRFDKTWVFFDGAFHSDSALLVLVNTALAFKTFKTQHFVSDNERLVVTEADPSRRIVKEINGLPAAEEYARVIGVSLDELGAFSFAAAPVVVVIDGTDYVRSIQKANPDGSLTFFCAIEEGLVLRVAHGDDLLKNLVATFADIEREIGRPQLILACDCVLRNLEIAQSGLGQQVGDLFHDWQGVGFSTYGEQYGGVHVNQTLTGIAIGGGKRYVGA